MRKILACTDFSPRSEGALRRAQVLAAAKEARLVVASVIDSDFPTPVADAIADSARLELERHCATGPGGCPELHVETGAPVETLCRVIAEVAPDLVVLGTHRPRPLWDMVSGTTAERIIRATSLPVLLAAGPPEPAWRRVLCGLDLSPASAAAARWAAELAPEAELRAFHALPVPFRGWTAAGGAAELAAPFLSDARARLDLWWLEEVLPARLAKPAPVALPVTEAFAAELDAFRPDLVAIGAHARAAFVPGHLGSFTEALIRRPPCDLLILRG
ncbi:universal stress protein [Poseidonocella sp. HB161398]|uniref:universal stress protein n=1 Tax=Poseidonocella sp. HB161398 TaxID=2320855 RepID=UPI00148723BB|nr:universal stress protein [Poseidonocella sp. HB161398]